MVESNKYIHSRLVVRTEGFCNAMNAIFHWLSIRCVSSYKKVILSHILHSLSCLAYCIRYFVKQICYFPSLPPFGGVAIVTVKLISVVHLSHLAIGYMLKATSPKLCYLVLVQLC